ncbi:hypothetical protein C8R46DRAFT_882597 [Mycena filopes]|nr:hypothetical protein C8R46DRAFT_882597 [Mycena filopes]
MPPPVHQPSYGSPFLSPQPTPGGSPGSPSPSVGADPPRGRNPDLAGQILHRLSIRARDSQRQGKRCTREVKSRGPAFSYLLAGDDVDVDGNTSSEGAVERFCFQHIKDFIGGSGSVTGFYARKWKGEGKPRGDEVWVSFADYIPPYLSPETQVALRVEMEKARSPKDVDGYIYTFEIRGKLLPTIKLKTGRTDTPCASDLTSGRKQCSSKEMVLRGWWPGGVDPNTGLPATSLMKGRVDAGSKGPACHRLERLIHLELADLVAEGQYLKPNWKSFKKGQPPPAAASLGSGPKCPDCGTQHKEIFTFTRVKKGPYKGKEWESIVKPIVERWGQFVEEACRMIVAFCIGLHAVSSLYLLSLLFIVLISLATLVPILLNMVKNPAIHSSYSGR